MVFLRGVSGVVFPLDAQDSGRNVAGRKGLWWWWWWLTVGSSLCG